jgi:hypothetical protein
MPPNADPPKTGLRVRSTAPLQAAIRRRQTW